MEYGVDGDDLVFSTGKRLDAHLGIVGINGQLEVFEGYDGGLRCEKLTEAERAELANHMISLWEKWKG